MKHINMYACTLPPVISGEPSASVPCESWASELSSLCLPSGHFTHEAISPSHKSPSRIGLPHSTSDLRGTEMSHGSGGFRCFLPGYGCLEIRIRLSSYLDDLKVSPGVGNAGAEIKCSLQEWFVVPWWLRHSLFRGGCGDGGGTVSAGEGSKLLDGSPYLWPLGLVCPPCN